MNMAERRSSRPKKAMKYSAFEELSDDDFADSTPPPPKKSKVAKSSEKKDVTPNKSKEVSLGQTVADVYTPDSNRKRRVPVSDKIYERELQQALEMSLLQSSGSQDSQETKANSGIDQEKETKDKEIESKETALKTVPGVVVEEKIELIKDKEETSGAVGRGISRKCREKQEKQKVSPVKGKLRLESDDEDGDDDYTSDEEDASGDSVEEQESEDSDFGHQPVKKKKTPVKNVKKIVQVQQKEKGNVKPSLATSSSKEKSVVHAPSKSPGPSSLTKAVTSTTAKAIPAPSTIKAPSRSPSVPSSLTSSWKPPAFSSTGNSNVSVMKSPTSGLRLGLSRNQRVKSLHPSVHVT